ncbi:MAG: ATP-binding protein [Patescibacteria group bacterium]|jgi:signal transduction histidine kinase|nr:ATP-binding protein [Patescibacteria group bacterium]
MLNIQTERKIEVNRWLINIRWFYGIGVFIIGALSKILSKSNVNFSILNMLLLLLIFGLINFTFEIAFRKISQNKSIRAINALSLSQMLAEIGILTIIMHYAGGIESVAISFFFIPIVSASYLLGAKGSIIAALLSALMINLLVTLEYFGVIPHVYRYEETSPELYSLPISLTKTITISIFYLIIGVYSGYGAKLLFNREDLLENQAKQLSKKTKLLSKREKTLSSINTSLTEEKNKIESIISNFTGPIIFINSKKEISLINPSAKEFLGINENDYGTKVSSKNNYALENFSKLIKNDFKITNNKGELDKNNKPIEEIELKNNKDTKTYKVITTSVCRGENKDACYGFLKIFYDLTREKEIDKMKSEFISIAAHQLRTPLSAIKWVIKMILDEDVGNLNKEQTELLEKGYKSNERIIELVNDLLNVSRIEEGRFGYNFSMSDLQEVIDIVTEDTERLIAKNNQKFIVNKPEVLPKIYMDKDRILLVLQNLLDNAVKYTPEFGKVEVNIKKENDNFIKISVKDNGVGVPEKDKVKLFTIFFRARNVKRMQTEGSGLGLFIAKNIVENHQGSILVESEEGKGTEISFTLPLKNIKIKKEEN